ncbi:bifunctional 4-hydroxy-2-oxoglutarate aldolase/2-dehydro-3-deoxy-phosphogluconate aldolase [Halanaerobium salsuginis]|jgi:2-dehydro-3-deoxyphosphogluconate aldolase/(4S)-4-hydroxy-2-oxoglutarate aldolase|uniref:2-dehydro-3-deoxyphosphogluconate aldolase / (4S)-4-hydroxy-2-oxoglutarate aldolase n=1 Tax=Halanaerobium salsuginis TaxID=29563 RepID=A0A1I4GLI3_9FIRM|nr:bifunctional 4-hydroxy-2-oxoglutarate aldolase/2-dehydro-3-deoxy-phosphogluconate aldolase [Halanaerobium salsuginis]SFL30350.1 2-dehydro-3-deoxyphosphogluconate aldolase / (4S)-4-hydroxy-2-oxoglutarate aldolase [Halanaerobium salsuginis]
MENVAKKIKKEKVIAIIRTNYPEKIDQIMDSLYQGGIKIVEVSLTTNNAYKLIKDIRKKFPNMSIGAGTVLDKDSVKKASLCGASFLLSPILNKTALKYAIENDIVLIPGVFSPSEAMEAHNLGAEIIKLFPARNLHPSYISDLKAPLPNLEIMAVGGISLENAAEFLQKGSCCLGIGSSLVDDKLVKTENFLEIKNRSKKFVELAKKVNNKSN